MKRAGFTMIELIFVIVILGILSAVALPKFIGVSEQAQAGKCKAAAGTLNRTVGPALWAEAMANGGTDFTITDANLTAQLPWPTELSTACGNRLDTNGTAGGTFGAFSYTAGTASASPKWVWTKK